MPVYLSNMVFKNNSVIYTFSINEGGSAIYNSGTTFIDNCTFDSNYISEKDYAFGGVISNSGELYIRDSRFVNNSVRALRSGGSVIYSKELMQIRNSTFLNNSMCAQYAIGGVIYVVSSSSTIILDSKISNTTITHYESKYGRVFGSSIAHKGLCLEIINSTIENNLIGNNCYWWVNNIPFLIMMDTII